MCIYIYIHTYTYIFIHIYIYIYTCHFLLPELTMRGDGLGILHGRRHLLNLGIPRGTAISHNVWVWS